MARIWTGVRESKQHPPGSMRESQVNNMSYHQVTRVPTACRPAVVRLTIDTKLANAQQVRPAEPSYPDKNSDETYQSSFDAWLNGTMKKLEAHVEPTLQRPETVLDIPESLRPGPRHSYQPRKPTRLQEPFVPPSLADFHKERLRYKAEASVTEVHAPKFVDKDTGS